MNSRIPGVDYCLFNDWQSRVAVLHDLATSAGEVNPWLYVRCLQRLFLGPQAGLLSETYHKEFIMQIHKVLHSMFKKSMVKRCIHDPLIREFKFPKVAK